MCRFWGQRRYTPLSKFAADEIVKLCKPAIRQASLNQASGFTTVACIPFGPFWLSNSTV